MKQLKERIKELAERQSEIKGQRKTVYFTGERIMTVDQACLEVYKNKYDLRHMYAAYAILRGREIPRPTKASFSDMYVDRLVQEYAEPPKKTVIEKIVNLIT